MPLDQSTSPVQLSTPLGANQLLVERYSGEERISAAFLPQRGPAQPAEALFASASPWSPPRNP